MTETFYFFDNQPIYQADWVKTIGKSLQDGVICGVDDDLFVYADASGMQVKIKPGAAHIKGNYFFSDQETILPVSAAPTTAGQYRYDWVVCEVDWTARSMTLKIVEGTPGSSPSLPTLTRSSTVFQIPLARLTVSYGDTNVPANKVLDYRSWALGVYAIPFVIGSAQSVITTGPVPVAAIVPVRGKIYRVDMVADQTGSITIDVWKKVLSSYPPTVSESICASGNKPSLSSARSGYKYVWNEATYPNMVSLNWPGHVIDKPSETDFWPYAILLNVDSVATIKQVNVTLWIARSISPLS
ncbi:hypothetical protein ADN00_15670 [Ornatilinea apprima]|uniref:Uncharacterized protein n=1 Tax=Ornatilinea apprima TaxID=1134406 RepID=A0A0P6WZK2_9CHLR|nr:hypothetical protein [Ornatilinea apprima]KPL72254.1 hypothetical protein ADN00_15670 [Ornatilinea apprima]